MTIKTEQELYDELRYYTLSHPDPRFIHQHVVDAWAAQTASPASKPINITFALIGLYLYLEKGYSGKEVQVAHMQLAKAKRKWPTFKLPDTRGDIAVSDVLATPPGPERDRKIQEWCASVWAAYSQSREQVIDVLKKR